jgi:hypothetical protein
MTYQGRIIVDIADRARLPWRFHARVTTSLRRRNQIG